MKKVKDHLNEQRYWDIFTISEESDLFEASKLMYKNKIGALMIVKADSIDLLCKSSVVGILTERDIVYALSGGNKSLQSKTVFDVMTKKLQYAALAPYYLPPRLLLLLACLMDLRRSVEFQIPCSQTV